MKPNDLKELEITAKKAVKEFAEKLEKRSFWLCDSNGRSHKVIYLDDVDNFMTELYGEDNYEDKDI